MPKVALFLGAGASRAFDYPTTKEFLAHLTKGIEHYGYSEIVKTYLENKKVEDIEHILQILDTLIDLQDNALVAELFGKYPPEFIRKSGFKGWYNIGLSVSSLRE